MGDWQNRMLLIGKWKTLQLKVRTVILRMEKKRYLLDNTFDIIVLACGTTKDKETEKKIDKIERLFYHKHMTERMF